MADSSSSNNENGLTQAINEADTGLDESMGVSPDSTATDEGSKVDQEGSAAKPETAITAEDAKEITQTLVNGLFGIVERVAPITYEEKTKSKGVEVYSPLVLKYGPVVFPLFGKKFSMIKFYQEFGAEIRAAYFTVEVVVGSYRAIQDAKRKEAEDHDEKENDKAA